MGSVRRRVYVVGSVFSYFGNNMLSRRSYFSGDVVVSRGSYFSNNVSVVSRSSDNFGYVVAGRVYGGGYGLVYVSYGVFFNFYGFVVGRRVYINVVVVT